MKDPIILSILESTKQMEKQLAFYVKNEDHVNANRMYDEIEKKQLNMAKAHAPIMNHLIANIPDYEPKFVAQPANWKAVTITMPTDNIQPLDDIHRRIDKFFNNKKFTQYIYAIEHLSSNRHIHISAQFNRKRFPSQEFRDTLQKHFPLPYDISKFTNYKGKKVDHLASKTYTAIESWIDYIKKEEPDKQVHDYLST